MLELNIKNTIYPCSKFTFWITRIGLYFLFPPIFMLVPEITKGLIQAFLFNNKVILPENRLLWYVIATVIAASIAMIISKNTTFEITDKSVAFSRKFIYISRKEVLLSNIKEVELKSSLLQRVFHLGTVIVKVQANDSKSISLHDIKNSDRVYSVLNEAISKIK